MRFPFFIARRFLARQKGTFSSFIIRLAILATGMGVAVMLVSMAFIGGFKYTIREKLFSFWGQVLVVPYDANQSDIVPAAPIQEDKALQHQIAGMEHVVQVAPFALRPTILQANQQMEGIRLKGINGNYRFSPGISFTGKKIDFGDTAYAKEIIISQTTANRLQLKAGDAVLLYFVEPGVSTPRVRKLTVSGLYHTGMEEVDKQFALCDLRLLQRLSNWAPDEISGYQVDLDNTSLADTMAVQIHERYIMPPLSAQSITEVYEGVFSWLGMQDVNARILLIIVSIVAIINLGASIIILMVDRAVMVGLLKALGMPPAKLRHIFLYLAGLIGGCGLILGNVLGLGLCWLQLRFGFIHLPEDTYYMRTVPVRLLWWQIALIDSATLALCVICTTLPTLYIRRIQPARVLQFK